ncbi:MAG TPA: organic hydroperoxide resistance protein [Myxococcales bacterium]|jgi:lipoyl-dependent peroxiredoxin|nr:organic hydroperoxide resistance protein [Myxococcales bacterium]
MANQPLYTAVATSHGGREGHVRSSDGIIDMDVKMPKELGGAGGKGTNPEQLFAAGYAACFEGALRLVARLQKKNVPPSATITNHVTLNKTDAGGYAISVVLHAKIPDMPRSEAEALVNAAHQVCPYSVATRGNIDVKLVVD